MKLEDLSECIPYEYVAWVNGELRTLERTDELDRCYADSIRIPGPQIRAGVTLYRFDREGKIEAQVTG